MTELIPSLSAKGMKFSPGKWEQHTGIAFSEKNEPGDLRAKGPHKGEPIPFGFGNIAAPEETASPDRLAWLISNVIQHTRALRDFGAEEVWIYLGVNYKYQCNLWFNSDELKALGEAGVSLAITCLDMDERK